MNGMVAVGREVGKGIQCSQWLHNKDKPMLVFSFFTPAFTVTR